MMEEIWLPVIGFEGLYEVSSVGRLRSVTHYIRFTDKAGNDRLRLLPGRVLTLGPHPGGYRTVHLYSDGQLVRATVLHIIVAENFVGPAPSPQHEVRHLDGVKANCRATNLAWGTHIENEADKDRHGTRPLGEKSASAKLTKADVIEIRRRVGELQQDLADEFGCTFSNISAIQLRKSWRHVA